MIPELVGGVTPSPADVEEIHAYVEKHRSDPTPFDFAVNGYTGGDETDRPVATLAEYETAGLTWWLERIDPGRLYDLELTRERILAGPPGPSSQTSAPPEPLDLKIEG